MYWMGIKMSKSYIIIPGCSDLNRGDQALVWETKRIAEEAGYIGEFYLIAEQNEPVQQSEAKGIHTIRPIIEHPSRLFRNKANIQYTMLLKVQWGVVAVFDFLSSLLFLWSPTRKILKYCISKEKRVSLEIMKNADAFFVKGGGLFQSYGGVSSTYSMYFWCYHIFLAKSFRKLIYVMANSFGPYYGPFVKEIAGKALRCCAIVTSRESLSSRMVKDKLELDVSTYPDLAFRLETGKLNREEVFLKYNLPKDRKLVALTMRPYRFPDANNPERAYKIFKEEMAKFIHWLYENGYMAVIVEHTLAMNSHENDAACIKDVTSKIEIMEYRLISEKTYDCHDLKCIYSYCDYIVGTRFHSVIFAIGSGIPGIAISYAGNKSKGIMKDLGLSKYVIDINEVTSKKLEEKFLRLLKEEKQIKANIKNYINDANEKYQELIKRLISSY